MSGLVGRAVSRFWRFGGSRGHGGFRSLSSISYEFSEPDRFGFCSVQGRRSGMEDSVVVLPQVDGCRDVSMFGVFDGFGGAQVSRFVANNLPNQLSNTGAIERAAMLEGKEQADKLGEAIKEAFFEIDKKVLTDSELDAWYCGSTGVCTLITPTHIVVANSGDSRLVMCGEGEENLRFETLDHKPYNKPESARIYAAGGFVLEGRIDGQLAVGRGFGRSVFKSNDALEAEHQKFSVSPDITVLTRKETDKFLVLASDGLWDIVSSSAMVDVVRNELAKESDGLTLHSFAKVLCAESVYAGSHDNVSIVLVRL
mmetsp:Transcript_14389/g.25375  ORF Transcript_14389/g.25375 Transcript_14389/m.25375 type:complete len:312 (-) Transcript_14389:1759-2694(-)